MPRIAREDHATIRHRIDIKGHKVAEVAAAYGCTPANIYAILARLRRQETPGAGQAVAAASITEVQATDAASADLLSGLTDVASEPTASVGPPEQHAVASSASPAARPALVPPPPPRSGRREAPARLPLPAPTLPATKAGYGLLMRTIDGEEAIHPFRSLEELLSAAKPILRMAARSSEPVWFSIQPIDLAALEESF
ncbi:hypothetical protein ACFQY5_37725 [Paeniroseomonas aquatica]|uniref:Uncharacterized protein n=1 Tax=Paeniroseomonas aquatica TaxID=373043 RepID=A0ABT8A0R9_9PROT|nr:hypothetical protein [Paeniroseomonas aquatica]MDN3563298.1 hypothetical protein [Paeniroseomonas aquatica]